MRRPFSRALILVGAGTAAVLATPTSAHHSFAMYDSSVEYVFTGIVVRIAPNPDHQQIFFVPLDEERAAIVRNAEDEPFVWMMEMEGSAAAAIEGVTVEAFPPGTVFSVGLSPLRNGNSAGTRGDGASQEGASPIFRCPADTGPAPGMHCDSVAGSVKYGEGDLPEPTAVWTP